MEVMYSFYLNSLAQNCLWEILHDIGYSCNLYFHFHVVFLYIYIPHFIHFTNYLFIYPI